MRNTFHRILRWSEKYTKTDMVYLTSGGFWLFFGQAIAMLAALGLAAAFANLVEPEKFGNYKYVLTIAGIIGAFTLTGLNTAVTRATAKGEEGTLQYAFKLSLQWSIGMVIVSAVGSAYYFWNNNAFLGTALLIIGATSPIISASSLYRPFLVGRRDFKKASLLGAVSSIIPTLLVLFGIFSNAPLIILVSIYFFSTATIFLLLYKHANKLAKNNIIDPATGYLGRHLSLMQIIGVAANRLDSLLIFQMLGGTELAIYALAITFPDTIKGSLKNIDAIALPKLVHKSKEEMKRIIWSKMRIILPTTTILTALYILAAPFLFSVIFPKYLNAVPLSQIYALTIPMSFVLTSVYFDSQTQVRKRYVINIVSNVSRIVLTIAGVYFGGLMGAIIARLVTRAIAVSLSTFLIIRD